MELGKNICNLRKEKSVTQEELAAELGVTAAAVSKWEKGYTLPDVLMVCAIADYFGITTDELLGRARELKSLVVIAEDTDRKIIERVCRRHGFRAAEWATDFEEARRKQAETDAVCILRVSSRFMTEKPNCSYGDCVYEEPEDLPGNLDTILSMMEKHL